MKTPSHKEKTSLGIWYDIRFQFTTGDLVSSGGPYRNWRGKSPAWHRLLLVFVVRVVNGGFNSFNVLRIEVCPYQDWSVR
jgi:hypothetical protein